MNIQEIVDNFALFDDWEERYRYLIDLGGRLPPMPDSLKTAETKVHGCLSQVWMVPGWDAENRLTLLADSDAQIVKGLIAVVSALFTGKTAGEIAAIDVQKVFGELGMDQHISPNRRNGFYAMVEKIRAFAAVRSV